MRVNPVAEIEAKQPPSLAKDKDFKISVLD